MKKILAFLTVLLFLILLWYTKSMYQNCCNNSVNKKEINIDQNKEKDPLMFHWNSSDPITNSKWNNFKNTILKKQSTGKILQIAAPYFKEEGKALGIARAKQTFIKMETDIDTAKVEFTAKLVSFYKGAKTNPFAGVEFNWLTRNENIQELNDKVLLYFPINSSKKINNQNISNYLKDVVKSVKGSSKKIYLSGHTDNTGNPKNNKILGLNRANSVKEELILLGLDKNKIFVISYGEEKPIDNNTTKEGRKKNRRVELEIK